MSVRHQILAGPLGALLVPQGISVPAGKGRRHDLVQCAHPLLHRQVARGVPSEIYLILSVPLQQP